MTLQSQTNDDLPSASQSCERLTEPNRDAAAHDMPPWTGPIMATPAPTNSSRLGRLLDIARRLMPAARRVEHHDPAPPSVAHHNSMPPSIAHHELVPPSLVPYDPASALARRRAQSLDDRTTRIYQRPSSPPPPMSTGQWDRQTDEEVTATAQIPGAKLDSLLDRLRPQSESRDTTVEIETESITLQELEEFRKSLSPPGDDKPPTVLDMKSSLKVDAPRDRIGEVVLFEGHPAPVSVLAMRLISILTLGVGFLWFLLVAKSTRYRITNQRIVIESGLRSKRVEEIETYRINDYIVERSPVQLMLGTGNLLLRTQEGRVRLSQLRTDVVALQKALRKATEEEKQRRGIGLLGAPRGAAA